MLFSKVEPDEIRRRGMRSSCWRIAILPLGRLDGSFCPWRYSPPHESEWHPQSLVVAPPIRRGPPGRYCSSELIRRIPKEPISGTPEMGFLLSAERKPNRMKPPFDIAGDLDTPVSAFAKLGAFNPRFLLESVEGGERLARYSFIGFGNCLEVKLDAAGLKVGNAKLPRPANKPEWLDALRKALAAAPKPLPEMAGV